MIMPITNTICFVFVQEITKWVNNGSSVGLDITYMDFQDAFDKLKTSNANAQVK